MGSASTLWGEADVAKVMTTILSCLASTLGAMLLLLTPKAVSGAEERSTWLASQVSNPAKRRWEVFNLYYAVVWVAVFGSIVAFDLYESFDEISYFVVCYGLCVPIFFFPLVSVHSSETSLPVGQRYGVKANIWIAVYAFIGNYWYTHYFYSVLGAKYTFPSWRLNDVPIALHGATIFYFCLYHVLGNAAIRKVLTTFEASTFRTVTLIFMIGVMSYSTAFTETLTISKFPYYSFENRDMAYVLGSAFYAIYFIVSFPMFYAFEEWPKRRASNASSAEGVWSATVNAMGAGMIIMCLLDFVRLAVGADLVMKG